MNKSIIYKAKEDKDIQEDLRKLEALQKELKALQQEPCEDAVSKQEVLNIIDDMAKEYYTNKDFEKAQGIAWVKLQRLPSVNPQEPKCETAKWIRRSGIMSWKWFECDRCTTGNDFATPYCPHCGAKMVEPHESEVEE